MGNYNLKERRKFMKTLNFMKKRAPPESATMNSIKSNKRISGKINQKELWENWKWKKKNRIRPKIVTKYRIRHFHHSNVRFSSQYFLSKGKRWRNREGISQLLVEENEIPEIAQQLESFQKIEDQFEEDPKDWETWKSKNFNLHRIIIGDSWRKNMDPMI